MRWLIPAYVGFYTYSVLLVLLSQTPDLWLETGFCAFVKKATKNLSKKEDKKFYIALCSFLIYCSVAHKKLMLCTLKEAFIQKPQRTL